jgi:Holliday junction resolvase-like predicted endonuclease
VDIVAERDNITAFVEVKHALEGVEHLALAKVDSLRRRRIAAAASEWLSVSGFRGDCRFDVILVSVTRRLPGGGLRERLPVLSCPAGPPSTSAAGPGGRPSHGILEYRQVHTAGTPPVFHEKHAPRRQLTPYGKARACRHVEHRQGA